MAVAEVSTVVEERCTVVAIPVDTGAITAAADTTVGIVGIMAAATTVGMVGTGALAIAVDTAVTTAGEAAMGATLGTVPDGAGDGDSVLV